MINFDYDSFHIRLIGNLIGYSFEKGSVHTEFGKIYFEKDELTHEEYELSKTITFRQLYSDSLEFDTHYFKEVMQYKDKLWETFETHGQITTPIFKRRICKTDHPTMTKSKLFNYYIQAFETEFMMGILSKIHKALVAHKSLVVLYVYDSILIDYSISDGVGIIKTIIECMEENNMGVHVEMGKSYHEMLDVSARFNL